MLTKPALGVWQSSAKWPVVVLTGRRPMTNSLTAVPHIFVKLIIVIGQFIVKSVATLVNSQGDFNRRLHLKQEGGEV